MTAIGRFAPTRTLFRYRALARDGAEERGALHAATREDASVELSRRGLLATDLSEDRAFTPRYTIPVADLALGLRLLGDLLDAGLPVGRALHTFEDLAPPSWKRGLPALIASVKEGKSLAAALEESPLAIPPLVVGIVYAGEAGSGAGAAVRRAADVMESAAATRAAIRSALSYPAMLAVAACGAIALLLGFVLPKFAAILSDIGQSLPASTRLLLSTSAAARAALVPGTLVLAALISVWAIWVSSSAGRRQWHELLRALPVVGRVRRSTSTSRAAGSLSALLESGVPLATAMIHAARSTGDAAAEARLLSARAAISSGERIGRALADADAMTVVAVRLASAGEETGRLSAMLGHAARLERERAELVVRTAVRFVEPSMILVFGGLVAMVAAALLQAVYSVKPGA